MLPSAVSKKNVYLFSVNCLHMTKIKKKRLVDGPFKRHFKICWESQTLLNEWSERDVEKVN